MEKLSITPEQLRQWREKKSAFIGKPFLQEDAAEFIRVERITYASYEQGTRKPSQLAIEKILDDLKVIPGAKKPRTKAKA